MPIEVFDIKIEDTKKVTEDSIRIANDNIKGTFRVIRFKDKDTDQIVLFMPALDISGYGETREKAKEMLHEAAGDYLKHFATLSHKKQKQALIDLGWKQNRLSNKGFSNTYVDITGKLQGFNAENIELLTLEAA